MSIYKTGEMADRVKSFKSLFDYWKIIRCSLWTIPVDLPGVIGSLLEVRFVDFAEFVGFEVTGVALFDAVVFLLFFTVC